MTARRRLTSQSLKSTSLSLSTLRLLSSPPTSALSRKSLSRFTAEISTSMTLLLRSNFPASAFTTTVQAASAPVLALATALVMVRSLAAIARALPSAVENAATAAQDTPLSVSSADPRLHLAALSSTVEYQVKHMVVLPAMSATPTHTVATRPLALAP